MAGPASQSCFICVTYHNYRDGCCLEHCCDCKRVVCCFHRYMDYCCHECRLPMCLHCSRDLNSYRVNERICKMCRRKGCSICINWSSILSPAYVCRRCNRLELGGILGFLVMYATLCYWLI